MAKALAPAICKPVQVTWYDMIPSLLSEYCQGLDHYLGDPP